MPDREPKNAAHREWLRGSIEQAQKKLKRRGNSLDRSMVQAILWGIEQKVAKDLGARVADSIDYADVAARKAREEGGWSDEKIQRELHKRRAKAPLAHERLRRQRGEAFQEERRRRFVVGETARNIRRRLGEEADGRRSSPFVVAIDADAADEVTVWVSSSAGTFGDEVNGTQFNIIIQQRLKLGMIL